MKLYRISESDLIDEYFMSLSNINELQETNKQLEELLYQFKSECEKNYVFHDRNEHQFS